MITKSSGARIRNFIGPQMVPRPSFSDFPTLSPSLPRRFLLPEYLPYAGIFHERGQPGLATHSSVNRVLAGKTTLPHKPQRLLSALVVIHWWLYFLSGASIGDGQSAVASNIANTTYRLQWWDFTKFDLPEISNGITQILSFHSFSHQQRA